MGNQYIERPLTKQSTEGNPHERHMVATELLLPGIFSTCPRARGVFAMSQVAQLADACTCERIPGVMRM